jgi:hypothetical protein
MKKLTMITATAGTLAAAALGLAGTAAAAPLAGSSARDTVDSLRAEGYNVQINGTANVPLSRCTTTGVNGLPRTASPAQAQHNAAY